MITRQECMISAHCFGPGQFDDWAPNYANQRVRSILRAEDATRLRNAIETSSNLAQAATKLGVASSTLRRYQKTLGAEVNENGTT